jgi:sulfite reductase alpha subunit-like flavoprotein
MCRTGVHNQPDCRDCLGSAKLLHSKLMHSTLVGRKTTVLEYVTVAWMENMGTMYRKNFWSKTFGKSSLGESLNQTSFPSLLLRAPTLAFSCCTSHPPPTHPQTTGISWNTNVVRLIPSITTTTTTTTRTTTTTMTTSPVERKIWVLFASQTGNSEQAARKIAALLPDKCRVRTSSSNSPEDSNYVCEVLQFG